MIYYQKGIDFYSLGLDFHGYMYFLAKTCGLFMWQDIILSFSQQGKGFYSHRIFEHHMKIINPDFSLWEFELFYQKARITEE